MKEKFRFLNSFFRADFQQILNLFKYLTENFLALSGRMTPVEMLNNFGLERSLTATYNDNRFILSPGTIPSTGNSEMKNNPDKQQMDCKKIDSRHVCARLYQIIIVLKIEINFIV